MSNKRTILFAAILVLLCAVCFVAVLGERATDRSFNRYAVQIDTAKVSSITIELPNNDTVVNLAKVGRDWFVTVPTGNIDANGQQVYELLSFLSGIDIDRKMSDSEQVWQRYGVAEPTAIRVLVRGKRRTMADFYCGTVSFDAQTQQLWTYVRNADDNNVYRVNGYFNLAVNKPFASWIKNF